MVDKKKINELGRRIAREFNPDKIVLFGSYAYGNPSKDSDVDLLVVLPFEGKPAAKAVEIRLKVRPGFPVDFIVRTPENLRKRLALGDDFIRDILTKGKTLYEADRG